MAEIHQRRDLHAIVCSRETKVIDCVMRHRERMKIDLSNSKVKAGIDLDHSLAQGICAATRLVTRNISSLQDVRVARFRGHVNRAVEIFHQHAQSTSMIAVLMRDQNSVET